MISCYLKTDNCNSSFGHTKFCVQEADFFPFIFKQDIGQGSETSGLWPKYRIGGRCTSSHQENEVK